jgi:flagellar basal-body rod modification protein FlgD
MPILGGVNSTPAADPNSQAAVAQKKLDEDLNRFLTLLITQLENQDPLDPMDASEFTSQLVQFASVEQQISQNSNLEKLLNVTQTSQVGDMVSFIGTEIEYSGDLFELEGELAKFTYTLDSKAAKVDIAVRDQSGRTVFNAVGENDIGTHGFVWDGTGNSGLPQPDGPYTLIISAIGPDGEIQGVKKTVFGQVSGAGAEDGVVSLFIHGITVPLDQVLSVSEAIPLVPVNTNGETSNPSDNTDDESAEDDTEVEESAEAA